MTVYKAICSLRTARTSFTLSMVGLNSAVPKFLDCRSMRVWDKQIHNARNMVASTWCWVKSLVILQGGAVKPMQK